MKDFLLILLTATSALAAPGDIIVQRENVGSPKYTQILLTPDNGKVLGWNGTTLQNLTVASSWSSITGKPTTLTGYGITDAAPATGILPSAITGTAVITTDPRLSDSRPPTAHSHAFADLTDKTSIDLPATNTPLATALSGKVNLAGGNTITGTQVFSGSILGASISATSMAVSGSFTGPGTGLTGTASGLTVGGLANSTITGTVAFASGADVNFRTALGLGTMATQPASIVAITGGAINGTTIGATAPTTGAFTAISGNSLTTSGQSLTGSQATNLADLSTTWNTTGAPTALKVNVTNTASNAASLLLDLQVDGTTKGSITKNGVLRLPEAAYQTPAIQFGSTSTGIGSWNSGEVDIICGGVAVTRIATSGFATSLPIFLGLGYNVALSNSASGVAEINNGTTGAFRDLKLRNLEASGTINVTNTGNFTGITILNGTAGMTAAGTGGLYLSHQSVANLVVSNVSSVKGAGVLNSGAFYFAGTNLGAPSVNTSINRISDGLIGIGTAISSPFAGSVKLTNLEAVGSISQRPGIGTTVTPASNGDLMIETVSNTEVKIKLKGSDGVVRSISLTLAP
jgi:hypothetical protein